MVPPFEFRRAPLVINYLIAEGAFCMGKTSIKCPICGGQINILAGTMEAEIINCSHCSNRLLVAKINDGQIILEEAPSIEEDWGE